MLKSRYFIFSKCSSANEDILFEIWLLKVLIFLSFKADILSVVFFLISSEPALVAINKPRVTGIK